jgi:hypothetical protein
LCRFSVAGLMVHPRAEAVGGRKTLRHEVAGYWALASSECYWDLMSAPRSNAAGRQHDTPVWIEDRESALGMGRPVGAAIATGEAGIGVQQVAELRPVPGVDQFAELPGELQKQIPYSAGVSAKDRVEARHPHE